MKTFRNICKRNGFIYRQLMGITSVTTSSGTINITRFFSDRYLNFLCTSLIIHISSSMIWAQSQGLNAIKIYYIQVSSIAFWVSSRYDENHTQKFVRKKYTENIMRSNVNGQPLVMLSHFSHPSSRIIHVYTRNEIHAPCILHTAFTLNSSHIDLTSGNVWILMVFHIQKKSSLLLMLNGSVAVSVYQKSEWFFYCHDDAIFLQKKNKTKQKIGTNKTMRRERRFE